MLLKQRFQKVLIACTLVWALLFTSLPVNGQEFITGSSITGGSSAFVFRKSKKAKKNSALPRRKSKAKRSTRQKKATRRKVVRQSRVVAKKNRVRRSIKKVAPTDFARIDVVELQRKSPKEASKVFAGLAEYHLGLEDTDKAILAYEQAVELDKNNKDAIHGLSEVYTRKGDDAVEADDFGKAKRYYDEAIRLDDKNSSAYAGRGQYYDSLNKENEAKADYLKALSIDPEMNQVKLPLGIIYYQEGEIAKSEGYVVSALTGGEDNAETQYFFGLLKYKQGIDAEAEKALRKSIALDDSNDDAHYYLGAVLNRMGREVDAVKEFERATQIDDKYVPAWFDLGVAYYNQERWNDSIAAFGQAIKYNANQNEDYKRIYFESYANRAEAYRQVEDFNRAISDYNNAVSRIKNDADLYTNFGFVQGRKEKWDLAIDNFKKAAAIQSDAISYANLGWAYINKAAYDKEYNHPKSVIDVSLRNAKPALIKAVGYDSNFLAAYLNLGAVLNDLDESNEAARALENAVRIQKDWVPAMQELGIAYLKQGKYNNAIKQLKRVVKKDNKNDWAKYYLAEATWRKGDKKEARKIQSRLAGSNKRLADRLETIFRTAGG